MLWQGKKKMGKKKWDICSADTKPYPVVRPKRRKNYRHTLSVLMLEILYAIVAVALDIAAYHYLAARPTFLVVSYAIIGILWSSFAGATARRKPIDAQNTMRHPAIQKVLYTENTNVFLKSIKSSFLEKSNAIR